MRARSTLLAGSVRDRASAASCANSSASTANSITRRGAAILSSRQVDDSHYNPMRDRGNPPHWVGFMESAYSTSVEGLRDDTIIDPGNLRLSIAYCRERRGHIQLGYRGSVIERVRNRSRRHNVE